MYIIHTVHVYMACLEPEDKITRDNIDHLLGYVNGIHCIHSLDPVIQLPDLNRLYK